MPLTNLENELKKLADPQKAKDLQRFFKTGPGEYGEGDVFLGIKVPVLRKLSRQYKVLSLSDLQRLISFEIHEKRMLALFILVLQYQKNEPSYQKKLYDFYVQNMKYINNWDLVDCSAEHIIGHYLFDKIKEPLYKWAGSKNLWERRIAIIATFHYIKKGLFSETIKIAKMLLNDNHDLIHKAVGWMLREIGKRNLAAEESFLKAYYKEMPRVMLRYAVERFEEGKRIGYLKSVF